MSSTVTPPDSEPVDDFLLPSSQNIATVPPREVLAFERPLLALEQQVDALLALDSDEGDMKQEIRRLTERADAVRKEIFSNLTAKQIVQLSRHPVRPYTIDYIAGLVDEFIELHGDRGFADDPAIVGGIGFFADIPVMVIGHQKGRNTKQNVHRNFGMARPEGYRKAQRLMAMAQQFGCPVICFIDTPGAYPGLGAEQRGQSQAIASSLELMAGLTVPTIACVIGEGGSGGALALGVVDRLIMLEFSIFSVISPEGCASILWRDASKVEEAAKQLQLTAKDLDRHGLCDEVIAEPLGGAHRHPGRTMRSVGESILRHLGSLQKLSTQELLDKRYLKLRAMGKFGTRDEIS